MHEELRTYYTSDLYLASFLYSHGQELVKIEHEGRRAVFVFSDPKKCKELALQFYNGKAECDAREYARGLQELKSALFNI